MQNVNKFPIEEDAGNQQNQQENNYRIGHRITPPIATEVRWSNRTSRAPYPRISWQQEESNRGPGQRMSYRLTERVLMGVREDDRDDALVVRRRDGMIERSEPVFTSLQYPRDPQHTVVTASGQQFWRQGEEREWRRSVPVGIQRETTARRPLRPQDVTGTRASLAAQSSVATSSVAFRPSSSWSRGSFPSVAEINSHNQLQRTKLSKSGQTGMARDVQAISMSSSNGSSSGSPPSDSIVGAKRISELMQTSPHARPFASPTIQHSIAKKRHKPSPGPIYAGFDKLDLLCTATLEMGPLQDNPSGCSCPKSKCIALYCDCFKAGRRCSPGTCTCLNCKNTVEESGANGARTNAIRTILARNPRAFISAGMSNPPKELPPGQVACNCIRSRCLKLYCGCFQAGKVCDAEACTCISCLNTNDDTSGQRQAAIQQCLEKRPNAFQAKAKPVGSGCACKNNRCVRKYCECFREGLVCTEKCICRQCENMQKRE